MVRPAGNSEMPILAPIAGPLVTAGFHPLADFASFRPADAAMLRQCSARAPFPLEALAGALAGSIETGLAGLGVTAVVRRDALEEWLVRSSTGPFDAAFAAYLRALTQVAGGATFPSVDVALPAQMIVATMAWVQGQILLALGNVTDTITLSGLGGVWMDQLMLQLGIILEPLLGEPSGPRDYPPAGDGAAVHPYAALAGFGAAEGKILEETGTSLAPLASGVVSMAYSYLLSRSESAGYFQDAHHLAQRKQTLMSWWVRTASDPHGAGGDFGAYLRRVANAHVRNGGSHPEVGIPAQLTIALMAWVEMRVMAALNTVNILDGGGPAMFGLFGDPAAVAGVARAWMAMLTLQLGVLIDPHLAS